MNEGSDIDADVVIKESFGEYVFLKGNRVIASTDWVGRWLIIQGCIAKNLSVYDTTRGAFITGTIDQIVEEK